MPIRVQAEVLVGDKVPAVFAESPDGAVVQLRRLGGQWVVLLYEDRDTTEVNQALKAALRKRARKKAFRRRVRVVAVADTSGYDFWPAKGLAKSAIRDRAKKAGIRIYCDWSGAMREGLGLRKGAAHVVVLDPKGRVRAKYAGALPSDERAKLLALVAPRAKRRARPPPSAVSADAPASKPEAAAPDTKPTERPTP